MAFPKQDTAVALSVEERVLVLIPGGEEGHELTGGLEREGYDFLVCHEPGEAAEAIREGAVLAILEEECLEDSALAVLGDVLREMPAWSDLPLVVLLRADSGDAPESLIQALEPAGNIHFLERPLQANRFRSTLQVALRARRHQYRMRDALEERIRQVREESLANLNSFISHVSDGIVIVDGDGKALTMNPMALELHDCRSIEDGLASVQEAFQHYECRSLEGRRLPEDQWPVCRVLRGETFNNLELRVINKRTGRHWVGNYNAVPVHDRNDAVSMVVMTVLDVTQRKQYESQLEQINETLEARVRERTKSLLEYQNRLRGLASQLTKAEQKERRRLATDLHDYLAQMLVVCRMQVGRAGKMAKSDKLQEVLEKLDDYLEKSLTYTRTLVSELSPAVLYEAGLVSALHWLAEQMEQHGLEVKVEGDGDVQLPEGQAILTYQSVRELLFNVVKHGQVETARMVIEVEPESQLSVHVIDEGVGFDPRKKDENPGNKSQFGLFNVQERLEAMGGRLEIHARPGEGSRIRLTLPLSGETTEGNKQTSRVD